MNHSEIFTNEALNTIFPQHRSDQFFEALLGDASDGAFDITLEFSGIGGQNTLNFELHLKQRPGHCLACNLTYGLPEVFSRHPIINIAGVVADLAALMKHPSEQIEWELGTTQTNSNELHIIPLKLSLN